MPLYNIICIADGTRRFTVPTLEAGAAGFNFTPVLNGQKLEQFGADTRPQKEIAQ